MPQTIAKKYFIRAGNASMRVTGFVVLDSEGKVVEYEAPYSDHDEAIGWLVAGANPVQAMDLLERYQQIDNVEIW